MRSSNPPLQVFVEVVGLELVGICIDKFGSEDFYGFVENHVDYLIWVYEYCWELGILFISPLVFMFGL